jgi:hypothetical protein
MKNAFGFLALALAFFLATWLAWWAVPAVALLWGGLRPTVKLPAFTAAVAAGAAWAAWLVVDAATGTGALTTLATRLGGILSLPGYALFALTVIFPALLAWSAAALAGGIANFLAPRPGDTR